MGLKAIAKRYWTQMHETPEKYRWLFWLYNRTVGRNRIRRRRGNKLDISCAKLDRNRFVIRGNGNEVIIEPGAQIWDCTFQIMGNHNTIRIGRDATLISTELWISKDNNRIVIGSGSQIHGKDRNPNHIAAMEGTEVVIGAECIFSADVEIRTADGHSIVDLEGNRVNPSRSVYIGEHVWLGSGVVCTKGIQIADHVIVGTRSVVTRSIDKSYCAVGGNPARIIKEGLDWRKELLAIKETE